MIVLVIVTVAFLAFGNGANDNFKGVATLFGSGTLNYKKAISWATLTTFMGSIAAIFLAGTLVKNFSGKGLVPDGLIQTPEFAISIALGAGLTVFSATRLGMPISTTHGLVGALFGSGVMAVGSAFNFSKLIQTFLFPLFVSPLLAAAAGGLLYLVFRRLRFAFGITSQTCICVGNKWRPVTALATGGFQVWPQASGSALSMGESVQCVDRYMGNFFGMNVHALLDGLHYLSAGIVSFARGLNDTPKIAGLLLFLSVFPLEWGMLFLALAIALGGLLQAKKVGHTVSKKITPMNHGQGFSANLVTGLLVTTASLHGMPVSTTHVSVGSIFGIGSVTKKADLRVVRNILLSWFFTLPAGALCGALTYGMIHSLV